MNKYILGLVIVIVSVIVVGSYLFSSYQSTQPTTEDSADFTIDTSQWKKENIPAVLPESYAFQISFPPTYASPKTKPDIGTPGVLDRNNNVEEIDFKHAANPDNNIFGFFTFSKLPENQTLESYVNEQLLPTATDKVQYSILVDGRQSFTQRATSKAGPTTYFIEIENGLILELHLGYFVGRGNEEEKRARREQMHALLDEMVKSIIFQDS